MMVNAVVATGFLGLLCQMFGVSLGQFSSPCPGIFNYVRDDNTGETVGRIVIKNPARGTANHLLLGLSLATVLPSKYVGRLELAESREEAVKDIERGRPLIYRILFPLSHPIPLVTRIFFNKKEYCPGRPAIGPVVTSIVLEHTLYPPGVAPALDKAPNPNPKPVPNASPVQRPNSVPNQRPNQQQPSFAPDKMPNSVPNQRPNQQQPSLAPDQQPDKMLVPVQEEVLPSRDTGLYKDCGRPSKSDFNLLIAKGENTEPGDWPWLAAIFVSRIKLEFQCAGSLISNKHVLTAAHCLKRGDGPELPTSTVLVVLGRYRLRNWAEKGSVTYEVSEFKLHPDYGRKGTGFDSDMAIMVLIEPVSFGTLIRPICLWSGPVQLDTVVGKLGLVVGWGRDEMGNAVTAEPRMARVPIVSQEDCLRSNADFVQITSNRTFCAGSKDGGGPCNGDSGGSLVIHNPKTRRYHIRGIVSLSLLDRNTGACDLSQYVVYTDAAKYLDWLKEQIAN